MVIGGPSRRCGLWKGQDKGVTALFTSNLSEFYPTAGLVHLESLPEVYTELVLGIIRFAQTPGKSPRKNRVGKDQPLPAPDL